MTALAGSTGFAWIGKRRELMSALVVGRFGRTGGINALASKDLSRFDHRLAVSAMSGAIAPATGRKCAPVDLDTGFAMNATVISSRDESTS